MDPRSTLEVQGLGMIVVGLRARHPCRAQLDEHLNMTTFSPALTDLEVSEGIDSVSCCLLRPCHRSKMSTSW